MIRNEETYCVVYHNIVRELGAWDAVVYSTVATLLRKTDGIGNVSNQTLMDMCGINKKSLSRYIATLIESGYIEKEEGKGRGNISIYYITEKGDNLIPFTDKKRGQNVSEKGTKMPIKGDKMTPINKGEIKENKESGGVSRVKAQSTPLDTTPQNFNDMKDFNEWWELFTNNTEWQGEKENCERVWFTLQQSWRDNLVQMAKKGLRWRQRENDNPYWYLKNYSGEPAQQELPFYRQGTAAFAKWLDKQENDRKDVAIMRYDGKLAYCLATDVEIMEAAGAEFLSIMRRKTSE